MNLAESDLQQENLEEQIINEEYKIWKKNSPFLYDLLYSHCLTWPSLTVEWMPSKYAHSNFSLQKLLIGTHTTSLNNGVSNLPNSAGDSSEQNYAQILRAKLPLEQTASANSQYEDGGKDVNGFGLSTEKQRVDIELKVCHSGEVNRARYMPQQPNIIATKNINSDIHVFDYFKCDQTENDAGNAKPNQEDEMKSKPMLVLKGHEKEGYGLSWNPHKEGFLLSGSDDFNIFIWDINQPLKDAKSSDQAGGVSVNYTSAFRGHDSVVEDVAWHKTDANTFGSVSDDKKLKIWDMRNSEKEAFTVVAHTEEILSLDFSPFHNHVVTSSCDKTVKLWDLRNLSETVHTFEGHKDEVGCVKFSPHHSSIFASGGSDRRIFVWDISAINDTQTELEAQDGPPEILFLHGGHTAKISDMDWNKNEKLMMASVAEDNIIQIWQVAKECYASKDYLDRVDKTMKEKQEEDQDVKMDEA